MDAAGLEVPFFHSSLGADTKRAIQNEFKSTDSRKNKILITTSAFGMGIDIPDIRHVIHYTPALSITDYVQQIGRAGRDGQQSTAHLLYSRADNRELYGLATSPTYQRDFAKKRGLSDDQVLEIRKKLALAVDGALELVKVDDEQIWEKILEFFGETKPSFSERYRKEIIDSVTLFLLLVATSGIIWLIS